MTGPQCLGCAQGDARIAELEAKVAALEKRLAELEARFRTNASNSSPPPLANPIGAPAPVKKKKSNHQRGGQPGHQAHLRQLLPAERVTIIEAIVLTNCQKCDAKLSAEAGPNDPPPVRFQRVELPPIVVEVTEYARIHGNRVSLARYVTNRFWRYFRTEIWW